MCKELARAPSARPAASPLIPGTDLCKISIFKRSKTQSELKPPSAELATWEQHRPAADWRYFGPTYVLTIPFSQALEVARDKSSSLLMQLFR